VHDKVIRLRNTRIGHHVAAASGQQVGLSIDVTRQSPGVIIVNNVYVSVETELYDASFLARLEDLTVELRERVGARIDELRSELHNEALADRSGLAHAIAHRTPWSPPTSDGQIDGIPTAATTTFTEPAADVD
jgi:hypothetical protein